MPDAFTFNVAGPTRFSDPNANNEVALTTAEQAVAGAWRVECDVRLFVYTPNGDSGEQALCYIDARPAGDTTGMVETGLVSDTDPEQGRAVRLVQVAEFDHADPQTFVFLVSLPTGGAWVELDSIAGTATPL